MSPAADWARLYETIERQARNRILWFSALGLVAAVLFFKTCYNGKHDAKQGEDVAVMKERLRIDSLIHLGDSIALANSYARLDSAMQHGTQVVERWNTVKVPVYLPPTPTPHDTIASVSKRLSACYATGDSLVQSIVKIQTACSAFRDTATKTIADQRRAYAHLDSLYRLPRPAKRFGIGPYIGYGIANSGKDANLERRFSAGISIHYSVFSW